MLTRRAVRIAALVGGVLLLSAVGATPAAAGPFARRETKATTCPAGKQKIREDRKTCPANRRRAALVLRRVCCRNFRGRTICKAFGPCPARSPS
jgi:hypothetical protein